MAFFRTIGVKEGSILTYKIKNSLIKVKDDNDLAFFRSDPNRFQELTSAQVASAKKALATKPDDSKESSGMEKKQEEEKPVEEGKKGKVRVRRIAKTPKEENK